MNLLSSLKTSCAGLLSRHITERRKCADQVLDYLSNDALCDALCDNGGGDFNWSSLFDNVAQFFHLQLSKLEDDVCCGKNVSTKLKTAHESLSFVRSIVRLANRSGNVRLDMSDVLDRLFSALKNDFRRDVCGAEILLFIRDCVLIETAVIKALDRRSWLDLLNAIRHSVIQPPPRASRDFLYSMLTLCVQYGCEQAFICSAIDSLIPLARNMNRISGVSASIAMAFINSVLLQLYQSGDENVEAICDHLLITVIRLANSRCMGDVLEFIDLSLSKFKSTNKRPGDNWLSHFVKLFRFFSEQFVSLSRQPNKLESPTEIAVSQRMVDLYSLVVFLLATFSDSAGSFIPEALPVDASQNVSQGRKRVCVEMGVGFILQKVQCIENNQNNVVWLQILTRLLELHPELFDRALLATCSDLTRMQLDICSNGVVIDKYLQLAAVLVVQLFQRPSLCDKCAHEDVLFESVTCPSLTCDRDRSIHHRASNKKSKVRYFIKDDISSETKPYWNNVVGCVSSNWCSDVWCAAVKRCSMGVCEDSAHYLLQCLISRSLVPDVDLLDLLVQSKFQVSSNSLQTLLLLLRKQDRFPQLAGSSARSLDNRVSLIKWVISYAVCVSVDESSVLVETLTRLVLHDTSAHLCATSHLSNKRSTNLPVCKDSTIRASNNCAHLRTVPCSSTISSVKSLHKTVIVCLFELATLQSENLRKSSVLLCIVKLMHSWSQAGLLNNSYFTKPYSPISPIQGNTVISCISPVFESLITSVITSLQRQQIDLTLLPLLPYLEALVNMIQVLIDGEGDQEHVLSQLLLSVLSVENVRSLMFFVEDRNCWIWEIPGKYIRSASGINSKNQSQSYDLMKLADERGNLSGIVKDGRVDGAVCCHLTQHLAFTDFSMPNNVLSMITRQSEELRLRMFSLVISILTLDAGNKVAHFSGQDRSSLISVLLCESLLDVSMPSDALIALGLVSVIVSSSKLDSVCQTSCIGLMLKLCCNCSTDGRISWLLLRVMWNNFLPYVARVGDSLHQQTVLSFYQGVTNIIRSGKGGQLSIIEYMRLMASMCCHFMQIEDGMQLFDCTGSWLIEHLSARSRFELAEESNNGISTHKTRMEACRMLAQIIAARETVAIDSAAPTFLQMFSPVTNALTHSLNTVTDSCSSSPRDTLLCRFTELLFCMSQIFIKCREYRPLVLFYILDSVVVFKVPVSMAQETIGNLADTLGFSNAPNLIRKYFQVFSLWTDKHCCLTTFPHESLGYSSFEIFAKDLLNELASCVLSLGTEHHFLDLAALSRSTPVDLLIAALPHIIILIVLDKSNENNEIHIRRHRLFQIVGQLVRDDSLIETRLNNSSHYIVLLFWRSVPMKPLTRRIVRWMCQDLYNSDMISCLIHPVCRIQQVLCELAEDAHHCLDSVDLRDSVETFLGFIDCVIDFFNSLERTTAYSVRFILKFITSQLEDSRVMSEQGLLSSYLDSLDRFTRICAARVPHLLSRSVHGVCACLLNLKRYLNECSLLDMTQKLLSFLLLELSAQHESIRQCLSVFLESSTTDDSMTMVDDNAFIMRFLSHNSLESASPCLLKRLLFILQERRAAVSSCEMPQLVLKLLDLLPSTSSANLPTLGCVLAEIGPLAGVDQHLAAVAEKQYCVQQTEKSRQLRLLRLLRAQLFHRRPAVCSAAGQAIKQLIVEMNDDRSAVDELQDQEPLEYELLQPFDVVEITCNNFPLAEKYLSNFDEIEKFRVQIDKEDLWIPEGCDHEVWMRRLVLSLLDISAISRPFLSSFEQLVLQTDVVFCSELFPDIVELSVRACPSISPIIGKWFSRCFSQQCTQYASLNDKSWEQCDNAGHSIPYKSLSFTSAGFAPRDERSVRVLLAVLSHLRRQPLPTALLNGRRDCAWQRNFWLPLDLAAAARAALSVGLLYDSLFLAELWHLQRGGSTFAEESCDDVIMLSSGVLDATPDESMQLILLEVYERLDDSDGVFSVQGGPLSHLAALRLLEKRNTNSALCAYDCAMTGGKGQQEQLARAGFLRCLRRLRMFSSIRLCVQQQTLMTSPAATPCHENPACHSPASRHEIDMWYEACWRLTDWSADCVTSPSSGGIMSDSINCILYSCLSAVKDGDNHRAKCLVDSGLMRILNQLSAVANIGVLKLTQLNQWLMWLQLLSSVRHLCVQEDIISACQRWTYTEIDSPVSLMEHESQSTISYHLLEPVLTLRVAVLQLSAHCWPETRSQSASAQQKILFQLADKARAASDLSTARRVVQLSPSDTASTQQQVARNCWASGECRQALQIFRQLLLKSASMVPSSPGNEDSRDVGLRRACLQVEYASWLAKTHSESAQSIVDEYLVPATNILEKITGNDVHQCGMFLDAYYLIGQYADTEFRRIDQYIESQAFSDKRQFAAAMLLEASVLKSSCVQNASSDSRALGKKQKTLESLGRLDQECVRQCLQEREQYLSLALSSYMRCLYVGQRYDTLVHRIVAMWLNERDGQVTSVLNNSANNIPCHKWIPLVPQLAARLVRTSVSSTSSRGGVSFSSTLQDILRSCAVQHPHHVLPVLMALSHALLDTGYSGGDAATEARVAAASTLLDSISRCSSLTEHINQLAALCRALITLANHQVQPNVNKTMRVPASSGLSRLRQLDRVAVLTDTVSVRADGIYNAVATIQSWSSSFTTVGGINVPKKLVCVGSDGVDRSILLKGQDDLRQDAVMQQVFAVVNQLLKKYENPDSNRQSALVMRTYKVVPLSQRSGVIEWCANTVPMYTYLSKAHPLYRPHDMKIADARKALSQVAQRPVSERKTAYLHICRRLQPVFRHFNLEHCVEPRSWHARRCRYTYSVAVSSMVGYILGLGDRHVNNLLLDELTGELVHIDLGVAFDTGHLLPTPETVPFRLTRDIVDGMGVCGVEGWYRSACEHTISVLRQSADIILTIVRVLLDDPLYIWALTPNKVSKVQQSSLTASLDTAGDNKMAERVLMRLAEKLHGQEMNQIMTCPAQVNYLIQEAKDINNLCRMFHGWQSYL